MNSNNGLKRIVTISFSGAGHLLPYHLGAATVLMKNCAVDTTATGNIPLAPTNTFRGLGKQQQDHLEEKTKNYDQRAPLLPPIKAVVGSSSGSIAAAVMTYLPHKIEEYADEFIHEGGHAYQIFERMILEEEEIEKQSSNAAMTTKQQWELYVCGTRCTNGELCLFPFKYNTNTAGTIGFSNGNKLQKIMTSKMFECVEEREYLFQAIQASCKIPVSFHPVDMISWPILGASKLNYHEDGIKINDQYYCDGGIVAPAPPTPYDFNNNGEYYSIHDNEFNNSNHDDDDDCSSNSNCDNILYHNNRIVVTPIESSHRNKNTHNQSIYRISPNKNNKSTGIFNHFNLRCRGDFRIRLSTQNLNAFGNAMGNGDKDTLRHWYQRGENDAEQFVKEEKAKQN